MAPEIEMSSKQYSEIKGWIKKGGGRPILPNTFAVKGEPLVLQVIAKHGSCEASVNPTKNTG